ncbi:acyloxyacyl hydrolase [Adhaeribacter radiodurans]|uniref:Acyloxyacyl hydrolase n=1 Tax=Adhaeribacter radiodurans TaxID=2745197 RepID=A0A7L7LDD8_9BACT|nr:acyloxyacyl hydrolase [Adhaeribacter radiodurans]QMU30793.1 acyloxyacyl hydrolase [Adhaeribacter radiodurans]
MIRNCLILRLWFIVLGCFSCLLAFAQEKIPISIGASYLQGSVLVHSPKIRHLQGVNPVGAEINLQYQTTGTKFWHQLYKYPRIGISLIAFDYQKPILGKSLAASIYLNKYVYHRAQDQISIRVGTGLAYFSNHFDWRLNATNNVISAPLNAVIQFRAEYERILSPKFSLLLAAGINHYSNGGNAKPNLGINIGTLSLGLNYYSQRSFEPLVQAWPPPGNKLSFTISGSAGIKQRDDFDTITYTVKSVALSAMRQLNPKSTLLIGLEGFYDPSLIPRRNWDPRVEPGTSPDIRRVALNFGHELAIGKLGFGTYVGWYAYRPYKSDAAFYQRLETRYPLTRNIYLAAGLKLHDLIKADVIEYRLGFRFWRKKNSPRSTVDSP